MGDVSEYFKNSVLNRHKDTIEKSYQQKTLKDRVCNFCDKRRESRDTIVFEKRKINKNMTPIDTPDSEPSKQYVNKKGKKMPNKRLEMLQRWKIEKEKRKREEKLKAKPLFKVYRVPPEISLPNFEKVSKTMKGKPIQTKSLGNQSQFAPTNHIFHAPKNIKPIQLYNVKTKKLSTTDNKNSDAKNAVTKLNNNCEIKNKNDKTVNNTNKKIRKNDKESEAKISKDNSISKILYSEFEKDLSTLLKKSENIVKSVDIKETDAPVITINIKPSRVQKFTLGELSPLTPELAYERKCSTESRKSVIQPAAKSTSPDYLIKNSIENLTPCGLMPNFDENSNMSRKAVTEYFSDKLDTEIKRIEDLCDIWSVYKTSNKIPEGGADLIDTAVGQSKLLISKKFQQFRNLIEQYCENKYIKKPITGEDLHGFWDMTYMQVVDLDKRFNHLNVLKENNWQDFARKDKVMKGGSGRPRKGSANSALKNLVKAALNIKKPSVELNDNIDVENKVNKENNQTGPDLITFSPITTRSRSKRFSKTN